MYIELEVTMQSDLKFHKHIARKISNARKMLGCINLVLFYASERAKLLAYTSLYRPVKVRFEDETSKWEFLKRFANDTPRSRNIYCKLDKSEEVRRQQYNLRKEVRELRQANDGKDYRVRNMQIQQKSETGNGKT
jgi:hypothetical protein